MMIMRRDRFHVLQVLIQAYDLSRVRTDPRMCPPRMLSSLCCV